MSAHGPSNLGEWPDHKLVSELISHNEDAFAELFHRHANAVAATSRHVLGGASYSEDIVAEVFLGLWLAPQSFDPTRGPLLPFLRMKARGKSLDRTRSETARVRRESELAKGPQDDYEGQALESDKAEGVRLALAALSTNEREPLELAYIHGMTYRAIAVYLGIPEGTAKGRIRSGLRRIRETIAVQQQAGALEDA